MNCRQPSCNVANDGKCIDDKVLAECENAYLPVDADLEDPGPDVNQQTRRVEIQLPRGVALWTHETGYITRRSLTRVVFVAGRPECGKTTLVCYIYNRFQKGAYCNFLFAGSDTLVGYETRSVELRTASGNAEANPERTKPTDDFAFMHLAVRDAGAMKPVQHVLIVDVSGEEFKLARQFEVTKERAGIYGRADHFALLIDCEALTSVSTRHVEAEQAKTLVRKLLHSGAIHRKTYVEIVLSKWDLVAAPSTGDDAETFVSALVEALRTQFQASVDHVSTYRIAAESKTAPTETGHGVDELFTRWVEVCAYPACPVVTFEESANGTGLSRFRFRE